MRYFRGSRVLHWAACGAKRLGGQRLPGRGERFWYVAFARQWLCCYWQKHQGIRLLGLVSAVPPDHETIEQWGQVREFMAIKKRVSVGELPAIPALAVDNVVLRKMPLLVEFLTATAYEDGSARTPGYFTVRNRTIEFEVTLYDPDSASRIAIRARELDKVFFGVEAILGAQEAPWEPDQYLLRIQPKKKKGK